MNGRAGCLPGMARLLPPDAAPPASPTAARLEALLASLPDEWILIPDRRIGGEGGPRVGFVLLHPEIGIALVDLAPATPEAAAGPLVSLLGELGLDADALPVVAVAIAPDRIEAVGERLAAAFDAAPLCRIDDRRWPERAVGLLLGAKDAAMAPIKQATARQPVADRRPHIDPKDAIDARPPARRGSRLAVVAAVAAVTLAGLSLGAAIDLLTRPSPSTSTASMGVTPPSQTPVPMRPPPRTAEVSPTPSVEEAPPAAADAERRPPATPLVAEAPPPPPAPAALPSPPSALQAPPPQSALPATPEASAVSPPREATAQPRPAPAASPSAAAKRKVPARDDATKPVTVKTPFKPMKKLASTAESQPKPATSAAHPRSEPSDGPPLDAADLPPLEGVSPPPQEPEPAKQAVNLATGAPVPLPAPYGGPPAPGQPVMLLPPVTPPAAMPPPPSLGAGGATVIGDRPGRN